MELVNTRREHRLKRKIFDHISLDKIRPRGRSVTRWRGDVRKKMVLNWRRETENRRPKVGGG